MNRKIETTLMLILTAILLLGNDYNLDQFLAWSGWSLSTLAKVTASIAFGFIFYIAAWVYLSGRQERRGKE